VGISLILTVVNEADSLPHLLDSILAQTHAPDEIVIVDGGSNDANMDLLRANAHRLPLKIISQPGANISQGRNAAIRASTGDIICSTDAGVRLDARWVEEITQPFEPAVDVVSGFFVPDPHGIFETALAATSLPALAAIRPDAFLPSSRSIAYRKAAWAKVSGYPEWLDYCEDLYFDFAMREAGCRFVFSPHAIVHFRPRPSLRAFFKQYYQYARGDGKANLWLKRHLLRYLAYLVALPLVIGLTATAPLLALPLWLLGAGFLFFTPYRRLVPLLRGFSFIGRACALAWVPLIRVTGDAAKMIGYPAGMRWRLARTRHTT
jgi:glycosyltransferase involved in cell wall biosynthesis